MDFLLEQGRELTGARCMLVQILGRRKGNRALTRRKEIGPMYCPKCGCHRLLLRLAPSRTTGACLDCGIELVRQEDGELSVASNLSPIEDSTKTRRRNAPAA